MLTVADPITANGSALDIDWQGGPGAIFVGGTFNGATVTLQANDGGGHPVKSAYAALGANTTFTAAGIAGFSLPKGFQLKVLISGVGAATNLRVTVGTAF